MPRVCSADERMRALSPPQSMPARNNSSSGGQSGNTDNSQSSNSNDSGDGNNGNGGNNSGNTGTRGNAASDGGNSGNSRNSGGDDLRSEFRDLLTSVAGLRPGDREERLLRENFTIRDRLRTSRQALADAKTNGIPQGAVVLVGDDATAYAAYQKLGVPLKELPTRLAERDSLHAEKIEREATTLNERVATELGLNARAFALLAKANDLVISFKEVKVRDEESGKLVAEEVPMVRKRGDAEDKAKPLSEALESDFTDDDIALLTSESEASAPRGGDEFASDTRGDTRRRASTSSDEGSDASRGGVRFPSQRERAPSGASAQRKSEEKQRDAKATTGRYSM